MKQFTTLFCELDQTTRTSEKVAALEKYFHAAPPDDAAWALQFLSGRSLPRAVSTKNLWEWTAAETGWPLWLVEECHAAVGDTAETIALLLTNSGTASPLSLAELVKQRLLPLKALPDGARRELLVQTWRELDGNERFVWNKLITGNFRTGVARTLVIRALARVAGIEPAVMAHRVMGAWKPTAQDFLKMMSDEPGEFAKPYPFYLASPVELHISKGESIEKLGPLSEWLVEWKWDGIRAQLIHRGGETLVWSRGDEMISDAFPELIEAGNLLPDGTGIGIGISTALNMLRDSNAASRVVILLTDGEHNATSIKPLDAADLAAAIGVRVYTIGVQTPHPAGLPSGVDEQMLRAVADKTGGQYYAADNPTALAAVYKEIGALETSRVGREQFESFTEYGPWFIAAGAGLLVLELLLRSSWLRRTAA